MKQYGLSPVFVPMAVFFEQMSKRLLLGLISDISGTGAFRFLEGFAVDTEDSVCCFSVDIEDC